VMYERGCADELGGPWLGAGLGRATRLGRMRVSELSIGISGEDSVARGASVTRFFSRTEPSSQTNCRIRFFLEMNK
jgi:hypothetical protein